MNPELVLDNLDLALDLAAPVVADAPATGADPELADDLRGLVTALHFLLRRYRDAITTATDNVAR